MNTKIYFKGLKLFLLLFVIQSVNGSGLLAQDSTSVSGYTTSITLTVLKNSDGSRTFSSKLTGEGEKGTFPVYQGDILFYNEVNSQKNLIGNTKTDKEGIAKFTAGNDTKYQREQDSVILVKAVFAGSEQVKGSEAAVKFKDLNISINLEEKDSVRTISIKAASIGAKDVQIPLKETTLNVYIQGLFTKLKIGDCFIENGEGSFKFPDNIQGDENGNVKIFVRVEENENFGDVEKVEMAKWGQHRSGYSEPVRSLWSSGAPLWMIITLTILLVGVWSHYFYAIVQLVKIKKEGTIFDKELKND